MPRSTTTTNALGIRLKEAREAADLRLDDASVYLREIVGKGASSSRETLRRLENGAIPEDSADPVTVRALAAIYGVPLRKLSPFIDDRWGVIMGLEDGKKPRRPSRPGTPNSRWSGDLPGGGSTRKKGQGVKHRAAA